MSIRSKITAEYLKAQAAVCCLLMLILSAGLFPIHAQPENDKAALIAEADKAYKAAMELFETGTPEALRSSLPLFRSSAEKFARADDKSSQGAAILMMARVADDLEQMDDALSFYAEAIALFREVGEDEGLAVALNNTANIYFVRGENQKAREYFEKALEIVKEGSADSVAWMVSIGLASVYEMTGEKAKALEMCRLALEISDKNGDLAARAQALILMGKMLADLGNRGEAIKFYEKALQITRENGLTEMELTVLNNLGTVFQYLGEKAKALEYYQTALARSNEQINPHTHALVLNNIGQTHYTTGDIPKALDFYSRALEIADRIKDASLQAATRNNIGLTYYWLHDHKQALANYLIALELARSVGDLSKEATTLLNIGTVHQKNLRLKEAVDAFVAAAKITEKTLEVRLYAIALNNIGLTGLLENDTETALKCFMDALPIVRQTGDRELEGKLLNNLGKTNQMSGSLQKAAGYYMEALMVGKAINERDLEAIALNNLMDVWAEIDNSRLAIFYGKSSVNVYQKLRAGLSSLSPELQRSYLDSVAGTYRRLADLLIQAGRLAEAEQVLVMLKQEELLDFVRRDDKVAKSLLETLSLSPDERAAFARYQEHAEQLTAFGSEFGELDTERKQYPAGEFPKQERYDELRKKIADATLVFERFLEDLKIKFGQRDVRVAQVESGLRRTLERLRANRTAVVSTIVGKNELNIIVTTSRTQRAHTIKTSEEEINKLVASFRNVLTSPKYDPRPAAQALYDLLVKPIEGDLAGIKADTVVWSMDGTLRYLPPAALWDKEKGYLAERFSNVIINLASRDNISLPVSDGRSWEVLGVGVSKPVEGFKALSAVPQELDCIVNDADTAPLSPDPQCKKGVLNGRKLLDDAFTLKSFEDEIGRYPVIHIASHFQLTPGDDKNSFLLLGGGDNKRFTVEQLRNQSLADVELIVLSACNTATPAGGNANGIEIEGFGSIAQQEGAKAVMATLWAVFDTSTKDLMVEFYRLYGQGGLTKAEALRRAQITLMNGQYSPGEAGKIRSDLIKFEDDPDNAPEFKHDEKAPFAHPYYWSPFILIGNWR